MNQTALLALLVTKGLITKEEGEKIVEFLNNRPQSTFLSDAIEQLKEFINDEVPVLKKAVTASKSAVTKAKHEVEAEATKIASEAVDVAEEIAKDIAESATKAQGTKKSN